jgi:hypothetical protein
MILTGTVESTGTVLGLPVGLAVVDTVFDRSQAARA